MPLPNSTQVIINHLKNFISRDEVIIYHDKECEIVYSEIFVIKPNKEVGRDYYILLTGGLSALPMNVPEDIDEPKFLELVMLLPSSWKLDLKDLEDDNNYWPFEILKTLIKVPHEDNSWLGYSHTFSWGLDQYFSPNNKFTGAILIDSISLPEDFLIIKSAEKTISIYSAIPLYKEEMIFQIEHGTNKLIDKFEEHKITEILDINRVNTCLKLGDQI